MVSLRESIADLLESDFSIAVFTSIFTSLTVLLISSIDNSFKVTRAAKESTSFLTSAISPLTISLILPPSTEIVSSSDI